MGVTLELLRLLANLIDWEPLWAFAVLAVRSAIINNIRSILCILLHLGNLMSHHIVIVFLQPHQLSSSLTRLSQILKNLLLITSSYLILGSRCRGPATRTTRTLPRVDIWVAVLSALATQIRSLTLQVVVETKFIKESRISWLFMIAHGSPTTIGFSPVYWSWSHSPVSVQFI